MKKYPTSLEITDKLADLILDSGLADAVCVGSNYLEIEYQDKPHERTLVYKIAVTLVEDNRKEKRTNFSKLSPKANGKRKSDV